MQGRTYHSLLYHLVFVTKYRSPMLTDEVYVELRRLFREKEEELDLKIFIANGIEDHVHILLSIPPKHSIASVVQHLKGYSSHEIPNLFWGTGYGVFSLDKSDLSGVFEYIKNQREHHGRQDLDAELQSLRVE